MKRIGISQRIEFVPSYGEYRDCLDQQWGKLISLLGWLPIPLVNEIREAENYINALELDGVILTGGNDLSVVAAEKDIAFSREFMERSLILHCAKEGTPILGICRGAQHLAVLNGGTLSSIENHVATYHSLYRTENVAEFIDIPTEVNSYHNFGISELGEPLLPVALDEKGYVEAFEAVEKNMYGIMWHPERETPFSAHDQKTLKRIFE